MRHITSAFIIFCMLASCSTMVPVKKTSSPDIRLPVGKKEFLFISRFTSDSLPFNNDNKVDVFRMGYDSFVRGLNAGYDSSKYYNITHLDSLVERYAATEPGPPVSKEQVTAACLEHNANYFLSLDAYNLYFDQEVEVIKQEDGTKDRTAYYDLVVESYIAMYDKDGELLHQFHDERRIEHDKRSVISGFLAVGPSIGKADKNAVLISMELGRGFIQKFYPRAYFEQRQFYHTKVFKSAYKAYQMEDWDTVEAELLKLTESSKTEVAGKAAHNLTVLYENINRQDDMEYWKDKARRLLGEKLP